MRAQLRSHSAEWTDLLCKQMHQEDLIAFLVHLLIVYPNGYPHLPALAGMGIGSAFSQPVACSHCSSVFEGG